MFIILKLINNKVSDIESDKSKFLIIPTKNFSSFSEILCKKNLIAVNSELIIFFKVKFTAVEAYSRKKNICELISNSKPFSDNFHILVKSEGASLWSVSRNPPISTYQNFCWIYVYTLGYESQHQWGTNASVSSLDRQYISYGFQMVTNNIGTKLIKIGANIIKNRYLTPLLKYKHF